MILRPQVNDVSVLYRRFSSIVHDCRFQIAQAAEVNLLHLQRVLHWIVLRGCRIFSLPISQYILLRSSLPVIQAFAGKSSDQQRNEEWQNSLSERRGKLNFWAKLSQLKYQFWLLDSAYSLLGANKLLPCYNAFHLLLILFYRTRQNPWNYFTSEDKIWEPQSFRHSNQHFFDNQLECQLQ